MRRQLALTTVLAALLCAAAPAGATTVTVRSGGASATLSDAPWSVVLRQRGQRALVVRGGIVTTARGTLRTVTAVPRLVGGSGGAAATIRLDDGTEADLVVRPARDGSFVVKVTAASIVSATGLAFEARAGERFFGTGERSDAVDRAGRETENYVADGPFRAEDRLFVGPTTPPWAERDRDDATYFPVPWVLTSNGWGVLTGGARTSRLLAGRDDAGA